MKRRTREEWRALFAEQLTSGLSARQFCLQRHVCPRYFSLRRRQLSALTPTAFVPLRRQSPVAMPDAAATVLLRHGRSTLELRAVSPEWVSQLLAALA
jgi:hypothetical protein